MTRVEYLAPKLSEIYAIALCNVCTCDVGAFAQNVGWSSRGMCAVDEFIARANIEHFRKLLANEPDQAKRRQIEELLAAEEQKLAAALQRTQDKQERA